MRYPKLAVRTLVFLSVLLHCVGFAVSGTATGAIEFRDDAVLVKLTADTAGRASVLPVDSLPRGIVELDEFRARAGIRDGHLIARDGGSADPGLFSRIGLDRLYLLRLSTPGAGNVESLVRELSAQAWVEYAEPVYAYRLNATTPNDALFSDQWHHENTGQTGGTPDADMDTPEAWDSGTGHPDVVISFIDSGVDLDHPDLVDNLVPGIDLTDSVEGIEDTFPHGTQVAGNAAARGNNFQGVAGVCWTCSLMPVKVFGSGGFPETLEDIIPAIVFSVDNGADVINMSLSGGAWSEAFQDAIDYGLGLGVLSLAGSGNSGVYSPAPPAVFPNVISVNGTFHDETRYGNYGDHAEIAAPTETLTTIPDGYGQFGGTSGACPHAAGLAGLLLSIDQTLHVQEVRQLLRLGAEDQVSDPAEDTPGWDQFLGYGRINAANSVALIDGPWLAIDWANYVCGGTLAIDLKDTTVGSSAAVTLTGDIGGDEEVVNAMPVTPGGYFRGTIPLAWAGQDGPVLPSSGVLDVVHGETVTATAGSVSATASIDCMERVCLVELPVPPEAGDCDQDGFLDPGETWSFEADLVNEQTVELFEIVTRLETTDAHVEITGNGQGHAAMEPIDFPEPPPLPYSIHLLPGATPTETIDFEFAISGRGWVADEGGCTDLGFPSTSFSVFSNRDGLLPDQWPALPPANPAGSDAGCPDEFQLTWDPVMGAASYNVFRSETSCVDALSQSTPYGTTGTPPFIDGAPAPDAFSYYAIEGVENGTGCTTERACIHAGCVCTAPGDPLHLRVDRSGDDVLLEWDDPLASGFTWNVYRDSSPDPAGWGAPLYPAVIDADPATAGIQHTDPGAISAGSPLFYLVTAHNGCAESPLF